MSSRELETMLAALRDKTRGAEAPARVEAALLQAFRAHAGDHVRRPARRWWIGAVAGLAASVAVCAGVAEWWIARPVAPIAARLQFPVAPVLEAPKQRPASVTAQRIRRATKPVRTELPAAPAQSRQEIATEFLPLEDTATLAPIESAQVLRVEVPRSTMVRFGLPVNPERFMEPIQADVVFAQDGIARAIRFVK
jgi:hypothetical protein